MIAPNYLNRQFNPEQLNVFWLGDITYIRTQQGGLYLVVIIGSCSRKVISWHCPDKSNSELTIRALLAVNKKQPSTLVFFHSDQSANIQARAFNAH